jgi:hypothetical protein
MALPPFSGFPTSLLKLASDGAEHRLPFLAPNFRKFR